MEAQASLALQDPMACQAEMEEMESKETLDLQAPWAPLEEFQASLGVMGWLEPLALLVSVEKRENLVREALQGFQLI